VLDILNGLNINARFRFICAHLSFIAPFRISLTHLLKLGIINIKCAVISCKCQTMIIFFEHYFSYYLFPVDNWSAVIYHTHTIYQKSIVTFFMLNAWKHILNVNHCCRTRRTSCSSRIFGWNWWVSRDLSQIFGSPIHVTISLRLIAPDYKSCWLKLASVIS